MINDKQSVLFIKYDNFMWNISEFDSNPEEANINFGVLKLKMLIDTSGL